MVNLIYIELKDSDKNFPRENVNVQRNNSDTSLYCSQLFLKRLLNNR